MAVNQLSGCFALLNYSATIFRDSGTTISPNTSSIIIASIQCIGTYVSTILVDKVGRKLLLTISSSFTSLGLAVMGTYSFLDSRDFDLHNFYWVPVVSLSFVIFIASIGILPLPFIVLAEVLPSNVRNKSYTHNFYTCLIFSLSLSLVFRYVESALRYVCHSLACYRFWF